MSDNQMLLKLKAEAARLKSQGRDSGLQWAILQYDIAIFEKRAHDNAYHAITGD